MKLEREGSIGILTVDTVANNAINLDFIHEAHALMDEAEHDGEIRALVVTSTHRSLFCPGVDLPSLMGKSRLLYSIYFSNTGFPSLSFYC
jgi:enoyl-CoA hydratase/carnithine racemase